MRTLLALAASTLAVLAFSPVASAARYDVQLCAGPQHEIKTARDLGALGFAIDDQCAGSVPHITQRKIVASAQLVGGNTWTLTAPANTTIHTLDLDRAFLGTFDAGMEWRVTRPDDTFLEIANNQGHIADGGIRYTVDALSLTAHFFCQATVTCSSNNVLQVTVSNLVAGMDDSIPPTMSALSGPLVAGGPLRGTQAVTFSAHDSGAGIATVSLVVDSTATIIPQSNGGACVRPYKLLVPCALDLGTVVIPLDTTTLPDGTHTIQVGVADAAGNTKLSDPVTVTVRNAPVNTAVPLIKGVAKVGAQLAASTGAWDGSPSAFSFSYQWLGCPTAVTAATAIAPCTPIDGATDSTYVVTDADVNRRLVVRVTATNAAGSGAAFSAPTDPVAPGSGDGGPGGGDRTAPVLSAVSLSRTRLRAIARAAVLRLTSSEAGRLSIAIERARPGREVRQGDTLVCKEVRRAVRRGSCTVYARTTTLTRSIRAGRTGVPLSAEHMVPGSYRITITVRDAAGNVSKAARRAFTIIRG